MSLAAYWRGSPAFESLCDLVAGDTLVCVTGAGISMGLPLDGDPTRTLPSWTGLLRGLHARLQPLLAAADREDCERLLRLPPGADMPTGRELIMAASILRGADPADFDQAFRAAVRNAADSTSPVHRVLLELRPAGILTFNYDTGHENAAAAAGSSLRAMLPGDEAALREALSTPRRPFYLKAHGSLSSTSELVLTDESYRELLVRSPAYRAFVQNVFTNANLLFVGFGLSDPDFDVFVDTVAQQFGSPLRPHVAVFHRSECTPRDILLRRRYGIESLYVSDFADIPHLLRDALRQPGPRLREHLEGSLSIDLPLRQRSHGHLRSLGPAGRACAVNALHERIEPLRRAHDHFALSEVAYSLGVIDAAAAKPTLLDLVDQADHADVAGRALTVLRPVLEPADLPQLQTWRRRFEASPPPGPFNDRILKYIDYLLAYVPAHVRGPGPAAVP